LTADSDSLTQIFYRSVEEILTI